MTRPTVLNMDLVVVPREATDAMLEAAFKCVQQPDGEVYSAMLSASPYPSAWDDVRKYVEGLEGEINLKADFINATINQLAAAEARIAELEKRLADAEREPKDEVDEGQHQFVADWYRPARCQACGGLRDHPLHRAARAYMEGK